MSQDVNGLSSSPSSTIQNEKNYERQQVLSYRGPIPPPSLLEGYEEICPGVANRIIKMAELEAEHRHKMELKKLEEEFLLKKNKQEILAKQVNNQHAEIKLGQWFAFIMIMGFLIGGVILIYLDKPFVGTLLSIGSGLIALAIHFIKPHLSPAEIDLNKP